MGFSPGGILFLPLHCLFTSLLLCFFLKHSRRGTSCTSSPTRTGRAHCAPLSRPRAPVSALRLVPRPSDTEDPSAAALAAAPAPAQNPANAVLVARSPVRPRSATYAAAPASAVSPAVAARSAGSARGTGTAPSRCQSASSCLQTK